MAPPDAASATLALLQGEIQGINAVDAPSILDFLVERDVASASGASPRAPEELLVREGADGLDVGLFLDDDVLAAVAAAAHPADPRLLSWTCLEGVVAAAEGISHFVYLATRAGEGRRMSLLELELQAEVDKFAVLLVPTWGTGRRALSRLSAALRHRLFDGVRYLDHLGVEELQRYRRANQLAAGYTRWLEHRFVGPGDLEGLLRELRATYRRGTSDKPDYLASRS
jgi:hypothetical protein